MIDYPPDLPPRARVADSRRVLARMAFLRALAAQSDAISDLHRRRVGSDADVHGCNVPSGDERTVVLFCGPRRVQTVKEWAEQWKLSISWLHAWATYALYRWEAGTTCSDPLCPHRCSATRWNDPHAAFKTALSDGCLFLLPDGAKPHARYFGFELLRDVEAVSPNPILETKVEFSRRAEQAWNGAVAALARQDVSASWPRAIELHCEWLVRFHVLGETAPDIADTSGDPSSVYKAVRKLAHLIDLRIRRRT